jgi:hypothetical protein
MSKILFTSKLSILFLLIITLSSTALPSVAQESGYEQVHLGPGNKISDINFVVRHANQSARNDYATLIADMADLYGNDFEVVAPLTSGDIANRDVTVLINSVTNSTSSEVDAIKSSLESGNGFLLVNQPGNTTRSSQDLLNRLFETEIVTFTDYQINGSLFDTQLPYILTSNFNSPRTPVTQNITKLIIPNSVGLSINYTAVPETNLTIKDIYPLILDNNGTTLAVAIELNSYGRIIILGSRIMLTDDVRLKRNSYSDFITTDNDLFAFNLITWLGLGSGYINKYSHTLNVKPLQRIDRGTVISAAVDLKESDNNTLTNAEIKLEIEISNNIIESSYMSLNDDNLFFGEVSTRNTKAGTQNEIQVSVSKRGFIDQSFTIGRVMIDVEFPGPTLPNLVIIALLGSGIMIFLLSYYLLWTNYKKIDGNLIDQ